MSNLKDFLRLKQVGKGAFGIAWLVESKLNSKKYVIKELGHKEMSERERQDAKKEVMLLARMNHTNIVAYLNSFEEGGRFHILMEFCENGDLGARIKAQNGVLFKEEQILDYFVQICQGIKHIHDNKILHRDIKPQNIFLTKNNVVKLGDFGIAKLMNSTTAFTSTTVGTPFYFSPELCSRRMYNNKSDIWSLGCVLYELCTLNHAFSAQEMAILALRIKNVSYKPISLNYSTGLRFLISAIFQRDPRERPNINDILKKPFIARIFDKNYSSNTPRQLPAKQETPRLQSPAIVSRVNSGLNNRKVINKENLIANSPYLPPSKRPMVKRQANDRANALVTKKNEILKKGRAAMIINDRENAWKNVLTPPDESKDISEQEQSIDLPIEKPKPKTPGMFDHYYADLDRLKQQQEQRDFDNKLCVHRFQRIQDDDMAEGVYRKLDPVKNNIQVGVIAADRDKLVQDYLQNKQMAMFNRNRNGAGMALALGVGKKIELKCIAPPAPMMNHEDEMAERLNKIRQQNAEERKNQNIHDCNLNFDRNKGLIVNKENARIALEDLQKKIKLRSEELQQRLELKHLEKAREQELGLQRKEEPIVKPSNEAQNRQNNVILFPKRADPIVLVPKGNIEIHKVQDPRMTNVLNQLKNVKPSGDEIKPAQAEEDFTKLPSLSVVLNKIRDEPLTPRPTTAPQPEKSEIIKKKTDILKRLNKNQMLLDKVDEVEQRKSWAVNVDSDFIMKDDSSSNNLDDTLTDSNTMADVSVLSDKEQPSPRPKWCSDLKQPYSMAREPDTSKPTWCQNKELSIDIMIDETDDSIRIVEDEHTVKEIDSPGKLTIIVETPVVVEEVTDQDVDEILSIIEDKSNDNSEIDSSILVVKTEAWEKKEDTAIELLADSLKEDVKETSNSLLCSSSSDDRDEVSMQMRKVLEILSPASSDNEGVENVTIDDHGEEFVNNIQVTHVRSLPDLYCVDEVIRKRAKSESDVVSNYVDDDDTSEEDSEEDEDFCDDKSDDENIFLKIEMIRDKLETEIGLDPLIDAMEFVRESQDLDGDHIAARLREMLNNNEDAVNDVFHLVVLEEQYNNMD